MYEKPDEGFHDEGKEIPRTLAPEKHRDGTPHVVAHAQQPADRYRS
jgi:hypothetical protein